MALKLRFLSIGILVVLVGVGWLLWNWPRRVDMSQYAPSDSIVYLECNDLPAVANAITNTNAWKHFAGNFGLQGDHPANRWLNFAASLGLGPAKAVILARSQMAAVMLNLDAAEQNTTLSIKPEGAIIIETHTSIWRLRPVVEDTLQKFAEQLYGPVTPKRWSEDAEFLEWSSSTGDRRIIAALDGSLVVVGNTRAAVEKCLDAHRKPESSLHANAGLARMRGKVGAANALTFGYVSAENATRLVAWGTPLLFGREPGNSTFEQLVTRNAAKVLGAIAWSSRATNGVIEDRYFISLEPSVVTRLRPAFRVSPAPSSIWSMVPATIDTITVYKSQTPSQAWDALRGIASQFDAVSAVFFGSLMKAALMSYGIEDPDRFLSAVGPDVATLKVNDEGTVLIAHMLDRPTLEQMFNAHGSKLDVDNSVDFQIPESADKKFSAAFNGDYFLVGERSAVHDCLESTKSGRTIANYNSAKIDTKPARETVGILTCSNDLDRVRTFFAVITGLHGVAQKGTQPSLEAELPFATTQTSLDDQGLDRRTTSAFGQFSSLIALLKQD